MEIRLDGIRSLAHGEARTFAFTRNGRPAEGFLIRHGDGYYAYLNQCRHWPAPLDYGDADFFHAGLDRIMCKTHGAVYRADTGYCEYGPCVGASLDAYPVSIQGDQAIVTVPD